MAYTSTLKVFETLRLAFDEKQATKIVEAVEVAIATSNTALLESVSTKVDIAESKTELKREIAEFRVELKTEIAELRAEIKTEIAELRAEFKTEIAETRAELIKWMFIFWIGQFASTVGVLTAILFAFFKR